MKPEISETSYGFALTYELINRHKRYRIGAPIFPSLKQEGSPGGGYDVKIPGIPLFLQFKLSDFLTTKNALDYKHFNKPYYRFKIWSSKNSKQHQLLLDLEKKHPKVYYAAPKFHRAQEFDDKFSNNLIANSSVFVLPSAIGPILDNKEHSVAFVDGNPVGIFRSNPQEIKVLEFDSKYEENSGVFNIKNIDTSTPTYEDFVTDLVNLYRARFPARQESEIFYNLNRLKENMSAMEYAYFLSRSLYGSELLYIRR